MQLKARAAGLRAPGLLTTLISIAILHGAFALWRGAVAASDTASYAYWSKRLIDSGFDYAALVAEARTSFPAMLYALFATVLALLRLLFAQDWPLALVCLNIAAHVAVGAMVVQLAVRTTGSGLAGWTALLLFLMCFELANWVPYLLSDTTFVTIAFSVFTLAARRLLGEARSWWPVAPLASAGVFYRPTGSIVLPDLLLAVYLSRRKHLRVRLPILLGALGLLLAGAALFAWFMQDPARWPFGPLSGAFRTASRGYALGEVVNGRPATYHSVPVGLADYLSISADRLLHFFAIGTDGFSVAHWLASAAFFVPAYCLAAVALFAIFRGDRHGTAERKVLLTAFGAIMSYALFHGLVQVDFDWRYRAPILPHLILLAGAGAARLAGERDG